MSYVSFDVYGTLIKRILPPETLYRVMEDCSDSQYYEGFAQNRMCAEKELQRKGRQNYTLNEIYHAGAFLELKERVREKMIQYEEECEIRNTVPNEEGLKLYGILSKQNRVICISDMYLNSRIIGKILEKNGYAHIERIYVSCEENKSKRQGGLFQKVLDDLEISGNELFHIGDAVRSDFLIPKRYGISSKWITAHILHPKKKSEILYHIGFDIFGPVFYEFFVWLHRLAQGKQIYFLSREGEFLKHCYDTIYGTDEKILYVSRESVIKGSIATLLETLDMAEILKLISVQRNETNERFIRRLGADTEKYKKLLVKENLKPEGLLTGTTIKFLESYRKELILDTRKYEEAFWGYLQQNIDVEKGEILLVDIGWKGSMQMLLTKYLREKHQNIRVEGAYLGSMDDREKQGFLFCHKNDRCADVLSFSGLLESLAMPFHGSVQGYQKQDGCIKPVFRPSEHTASSKNIIMQVQNGICGLCNRMQFWKGISVFDREKVIDTMVSYGRSPKRRNVFLKEGLLFYETGRKYPLVDVPEWKDFLNPKCVWDKFVECSWKAGWMRKTFKLPLPWYRLLRILRKRADSRQDENCFLTDRSKAGTFDSAG